MKEEPHLGAHLSQLLSNYDFHLANRTRATYRPANTLLDIIATNRPSAVTRRGVTRCHYGSPHDFTRIALRHVAATGRKGVVTETRSISRIHDTDLNWSLLTSDWSDVLQADSPDDKWAAFLAVFTSLLDRAAPRRRVRLPPPGAPRITDETRDLLARRRALLGPGLSRPDYTTGEPAVPGRDQEGPGRLLHRPAPRSGTGEDVGGAATHHRIGERDRRRPAAGLHTGRPQRVLHASGTDYVGRRAGAAGDITDPSPACALLCF